MSKFLLNLLLQISKALVYSKIKFLFRKEFSFTFGPIGPAASRPSRGPLVFQPATPPLTTGPQPLGRPSLSSRPSRPRVGGALPDCRLPFEKAYFWKTAFPSRMRTPQKICHLRSAHISRPGHNPPPALACRPAQTAQPTWPLSRSARACLWRILQKMFSSLIHAFRSRHLLSLPSLTHGPRLSSPSSTPRRPTLIAPPLSPAESGLSALPLHTSRCCPEPLLAPPSLPPLQVTP
jgi:hypothetical protein